MKLHVTNQAILWLYAKRPNMDLTDLPSDIILLVFPYLSASDFLAFTSSTKSFLSFRQEPTFWRGLTTETFRIPPQPLLQADGARWQWLYRTLLTQSHVSLGATTNAVTLGTVPLDPAAIAYHNAACRSPQNLREAAELDGPPRS